MRQTTILTATAALSGLLAASSPAQADVVSYSYTMIDVPGSIAETTNANGINNLGQIIGDYQDGVGSHGYIYSHEKYATFDVPGALDTSATGINDRGQIVGLYYDGSKLTSYLKTRGAFTNIEGSGPASGFRPVAINDPGQILGYNYPDLTSFVDTRGVFTPIDLSNAPGPAGVSGFNNLGQFVGTYSDALGSHAFVDTRGVFTTIDDPDASGATLGLAINDLGQVAGLFVDSAGNIHGFVDTHGLFTTFDPPDSIYTQPTGISDTGQIAGYFYDADSSFHAFLATPEIGPFAFSAADLPADPSVPEPSTWAMMLLGFVALGYAGYRSSRRTVAVASV